jgi:hypothetical protein
LYGFDQPEYTRRLYFIQVEWMKLQRGKAERLNEANMETRKQADADRTTRRMREMPVQMSMDICLAVEQLKFAFGRAGLKPEIKIGMDHRDFTALQQVAESEDADFVVKDGNTGTMLLGCTLLIEENAAQKIIAAADELASFVPTGGRLPSRRLKGNR